MHPNRAFAADPAVGWRLVETVGLATIGLAGENGPAVVHAPLTRHGSAELRFHLARANRAFADIAGACVVASLLGPHGYVSPGWYADGGRQAVPTWNYVAAEFEGVAEPLDEEGLREHLDRKAADWEPADATDPWTLAAPEPRRVEAMLGAIGGFRIGVEAVRVTAKLSQNKAAADREGVIAGLERNGGCALAEAMRPASVSRQKL